MKKSKIPHFKSIEEESKFWDTHSFADYWSDFKPVELTVELAKPKDETLVVRLNKDAKRKLEKMAKSKKITTSTLARIFLTEKIRAV